MGKQKDIRVFFGIPAYGGMLMASFVRGYLKLQSNGLIDRVCHVDGDSLVSRARNNLTAEFLKSDCTHLLFIDTDIVFDPGHVKKLIDGARCGMPIVAGLYPKKQKELAWVINTMDGEETREDGFRRVKYAGTGFMLIARYVFERMINAYPEIAYTTDTGEIQGERETRWDFWRVGVHRPADVGADKPGRYLSEDWFFCQMMEDLGMPVMMDMSIHVGHVGQVTYPLEEVPLLDAEGNPVKKEEKKPAPKTADMYIPTDQEAMTRHVRKIFDGEYIFQNPTKDGDLIYDIGANMGGFMRWARLTWPNSKIVAFEPVPSNFEVLEKNAEGVDGVQLVNVALSTKTDRKVMFKGKNNAGEWSFFDLGQQDIDETVEVEVVSPADLPPAQFYKIDAEGSELDIVTSLDLSAAKAVIMEWHRPGDWVAIKRFFADMGWEIVRDDKRSRKRGVMAFVNPEYMEDVIEPED